jgi:hypothetical protein
VIFLPHSTIFDVLVGKINFSKKMIREFKEVTIGSWSYLIGNQPQKIAAPHSMGSRDLGDCNIQTSKFLFWGVFYYEFLYSKTNEN